jgi:hypothetical protein
VLRAYGEPLSRVRKCLRRKPEFLDSLKQQHRAWLVKVKSLKVLQLTQNSRRHFSFFSAIQ